jgi:serine/threonine-protein kinase
VVQTYEVGEDGGHHYIAMEYLEGQALSAILSRIGPDKVPLEFQLRVLCDALEGLHYAHELPDYDGSPLGIVHRDVSPQNVFVTYTGQAKILDFGIAKSSSTARTMHGVLIGKAGYMAPEQARLGELDRRTDLFAVGAMLWEALAKRPLVLRTDDDAAVLMRRVSGVDPKIRDVVPDAPPELADICDKAMARDPNDRYWSAAELRDAIEGFLSKRPPFDARRIAAILDEVFAEERTAIRRLVDEESKRAYQAGPIIDLRGEETVTPPARAARMRRLDGDLRLDVPSHTAASRQLSSRRHPLLVMGGLILAIGIVGLMVVRRNTEKKGANPDPAPTASLAVSSTSSSVKLEPSAAAEPPGYRLTLMSEPAGARVHHGQAVIGRTSLELPINNAAIQRMP